MPTRHGSPRRISLRRTGTTSVGITGPALLRPARLIPLAGCRRTFDSIGRPHDRSQLIWLAVASVTIGMRESIGPDWAEFAQPILGGNIGAVVRQDPFFTFPPHCYLRAPAAPPPANDRMRVGVPQPVGGGYRHYDAGRNSSLRMLGRVRQ